jgi:hypothetical protein
MKLKKAPTQLVVGAFSLPPPKYKTLEISVLYFWRRAGSLPYRF